MNLFYFQGEVHRLAKEKGWWNEDQDHPAIKIAKMHSELSELLEAECTDPTVRCDKDIDLTKREEECADLGIRLLDYCERHGINLFLVMMIKHEYNKTRPYMHNKRF